MDDDEAQSLAKTDFAAMRPAREVPGLTEALRRVRGPQKSPLKRQVTLRLDADIVDHFKASDKGWQTRMNDSLRDVVSHEKP